MRVLFLDDDEHRQLVFARNMESLAFSDYVQVRTVNEAISALSEDIFDLVFLDHDLGGQVYVDSARKDTGAEVVRWMVENKPDIATVVVHTLNPAGAKYMVEELLKADYYCTYIPFTAHSIAVYSKLLSYVPEEVENEFAK